MKFLTRSLIARLATSPLQFGVAALTTWMATAVIGPGGYSIVLLLVAVPLLLPFLDLGSSAPLISGMPQAKSNDERLALLVFAIQKSGTSAIVIFISGGIAALTSVGSLLFGKSVDYLIFPDLLVFSFSFLLSISTLLSPSQKALIGLGYTHVNMLFNLLTAALTMGFTFVASRFTTYVEIFAIIPASMAALTSGVSLMFALKKMNLDLKSVAKALIKKRLDASEYVKTNAKFMLVISLCLAIIQYLDRFLIAGFMPKEFLPEYIYVSQIYVPLWAAISSVLIVIWPHIAELERLLGAEETRAKLKAIWVRVSISGFVLAVVFALIAPPIIELVSHGLVTPSNILVLSFSLLLFLQMVQFPIGVYLVGNSGLRHQAKFSIFAVIFFVPTSIYFLGSLGTLGPVLATCLTILMFQIIPNLIYFCLMPRGRSVHEFK